MRGELGKHETSPRIVVIPADGEHPLCSHRLWRHAAKLRPPDLRLHIGACWQDDDTLTDEHALCQPQVSSWAWAGVRGLPMRPRS
jgi:hypothetical protein